jgi:hypothetical protein
VTSSFAPGAARFAGLCPHPVEQRLVRVDGELGLREGAGEGAGSVHLADQRVAPDRPGRERQRGGDRRLAGPALAGDLDEIARENLADRPALGGPGRSDGHQLSLRITYSTRSATSIPVSPMREQRR